MASYALRRLRLRPGEELVDEVTVALEPFVLGGERYVLVPDVVPAELTVTRASTGDVFRLRFAIRLHGPCMRCLGDAALDLELEGREYQATDPKDDDELRTEYVVDDKLEVDRWARDLVAEGLPDVILCRPDCAGLCPVCGKDLNVEPHEHAEERVDPRWEALRGLASDEETP